MCALICSHLFFFLLFSRAKSYAHARSWSRPQPAPKHAQWLYEYAPQQPRLHGWLQSHRPVFPGHARSEPNEHDPGAAHGKLWAPAKHEHAAKSRWNHSFVALLLLMLLPFPPQHIPCSCWELFCNTSFFFILFYCSFREFFVYVWFSFPPRCPTGPMMHQQPPSQQYNMPPGGAGQHYQGQQNPMSMMGQVNQGNHVMGQRPMPPYRPPQQGIPVGVSGVCKLWMSAFLLSNQLPHFSYSCFS